jgi:hypothetical protein
VKGKELQEYSELDSLYQQILQIGIDHPEFRNSKITNDYINHFQSKDSDARIRYETYAYMAWNLCETICYGSIDYDCANKENLDFLEKLNKDENWVSWLPTLKTEASLHGLWISKKENQSKFDGDFLKLINLFAKNKVIDLPDFKVI